MQAIFILSLFGLVYTTVAMITTMLATSSMQLKLDRIESVKEMFRDIELGINQGYLGNYVDFSNLTAFPTNGSTRLDASLSATNNKRLDKFVGPYVSWSSKEMLVDPWGSDIYIIAASTKEVIYADTDRPTGSPVNSISAPITAFLLVSKGPDGRFNTADQEGPPGLATLNQVKRYTKGTVDPYEEDNIVHVFTTFSAMNEIWNHTRAVHSKIMSVAADSYKQKYELFLPVIQTEFYDKVNFYDVDLNWVGDEPLNSSGAGTGCSTPLIHAWKDPDCNITGVTLPGGDLTGHLDFPRLQADIESMGLGREEDRLIEALAPDIQLTLSNSAEGVDDVLDFKLNDSTSNDWDVVYAKRLNGAEIIGGL